MYDSFITFIFCFGVVPYLSFQLYPAYSAFAIFTLICMMIILMAVTQIYANSSYMYEVSIEDRINLGFWNAFWITLTFVLSPITFVAAALTLGNSLFLLLTQKSGKVVPPPTGRRGSRSGFKTLS